MLIQRNLLYKEETSRTIYENKFIFMILYYSPHQVLTRVVAREEKGSG